MACAVHEEPASLGPECGFARPDSDWIFRVSKQCSYKDEEGTPVAHSTTECAMDVPPVGLKNLVHVEKQILKRPRLEKSNRSDSTRTTRKRTKRETASPQSSVSKKMEMEPRVGCPYYKHDPKIHRQPACRGKGFAEMGKLKDHLKDVHHLSQEHCDSQFNFKRSPFIGLKTLYLKWKEVYQRLFPEVPKDEIPAPYANDHDAKVDLSSIVQAKVKEEIDAIFNEVAKEFPPEIQWQIRKNLDKIRTDLRGDQNFSKDTAHVYSPVDAALRPNQGLSPSVAFHGFPTPPTLSQNCPRTAVDEGIYDSSPSLKNEGPNAIGPAMSMQGATDWQPTYDVDAKPALPNEIKLENEVQLRGPSSLVDHAAPWNPKNLFYTPQFGAETPVNDRNTVSTLPDYHVYAQPNGYTQPNPYTDSSCIPTPTFGDPILYPSSSDIATNFPPIDEDWGPTMGPEQSQDNDLNMFPVYINDVGSLSTDEKPPPPPSTYMEGSESFDMNELFDLELYDTQ